VGGVGATGAGGVGATGAGCVTVGAVRRKTLASSLVVVLGLVTYL